MHIDNESKRAQMVNLLCIYGASVNAKHQGQPLIHCAVERKDNVVANILLSYGCRLDHEHNGMDVL